jgi:5-methylcytosine-specific restriction enzyme subunit McrC
MNYIQLHHLCENLCNKEYCHKSNKSDIMSEFRLHMPGISEIPLTNHTFRLVQLHSNNRFYRFLMNVCSVIQSSSLVDPATGSYKFRDFVRDERAMARVFEDFLFNFIKIEMPAWNVKREHIAWRATSSTDPNLMYLPRMQTDISIRRGSEHRIIDAKYYQRTMSEYLGSEKFHSNNLYQLMSYLSNSVRPETNRIYGMLIYPQVERKINEDYRIQDFDIGIRTIDLNQPWQMVHSDLMYIFN